MIENNCKQAIQNELTNTVFPIKAPKLGKQEFCTKIILFILFSLSRPVFFSFMKYKEVFDRQTE